ncbi:Hypothetical predicted protein [Mytilus galloprovincialis]|uniref:Uncharacterized protein n=1 Tax=Mytilus galloprovincialis TaxID=29158 RepID=A0A8B6EB35_MYTGA|nr:Hypothetical predicted protein [Mytilus galloprovincialis]
MSSGQITISHLNIVIDYSDMFLKIVEEISDVDKQDVKRVLEMRMDELKKFQRIHQILEKFVELCEVFEVNTKVIDDEMTKLKDLQKVPLCNVCRREEFIIDQEDEIKVIAFNLSNDVLKQISEIVSHCEGYFFLRLWDKYGKCATKIKKESLTIEEVLTSVWKPSLDEWSKLYERLKNGTILCIEFNTMWGNFEQDRFRKELQYFEHDKTSNWIDERIEQRKLYLEMTRYKKAIVLITEIKDSYKLSGDFDLPQRMLPFIQDHDVGMSKLDRSFADICRSLRNIDDKKIKCLRSFQESNALVLWLRSVMKNGLDELKVFVDLAYNSSGDDGMDITRVTSFRAAVTGYAPLIFEMKENCDYRQFILLCTKVWRAMQANKCLPEELELQDVLQLTIDEEEGNGQTRKVYTLDDLNDLQSRLMLIGSVVGKEDIDRFCEIFDSLKILGRTFIRMLNSGCVLFSNFQVEFRCDKKSAVCVFVSFGEKHDKKIIRGKRGTKDQEDCLFVRKIADYLTRCLNEWDSFIDAQREKHYLLNYFSMKQLVFLQCELAKLGTDTEPSVKLYPLLSAIKHDCNREDVVKSLRNAQAELMEMEKEERINAPKRDVCDDQRDMGPCQVVKVTFAIGDSCDATCT